MNPLTRLRNLTKNAPWVVMAVALHLMVLAVLGIWYVSKERNGALDAPQPFDVSPRPRELLAEVEIQPEVIDRHAIPQNVEATLDEREYIPTDEPVTDDPHVDLGDPTAPNFGDWSAGPLNGPAGADDKGPPKRLFPPGGHPPGGGPPGPPGGPGPTVVTEEAILKGMRWLVRHQNENGSWSATTLKQHCKPDAPCFDPKEDYHALYDEGVTSLALLTFLGAGYSHESKQSIVDPVTGKRSKIGEVVKNGMQWLAARQQPDGHFTPDKAFLYNEALATMALAECYGLTQNRYWKEPAQRAVDFLQRAQRPNPSGHGLWGWRYQSRPEVEDFRKTGTDAAADKELFDSDTSVTTWCVMALKSAQLAGLNVRQESMDGALEYMKWVTADNGLVGYLDPKGAGATVTGKNDHFKYHPAVMSALGMCSRIFITHDPSDPFLEQAAKQVLADLPQVSKDKLTVDYYYWYYGSLALNQIDGPDSPRRSGKYWGPWNKAMVESVLATQNSEPRSCHLGGWITPDRWSHSGGPVYATALNVLTLEVYYRYENAFGGSRRAPVQPQPVPPAAPGEPK